VDLPLCDECGERPANVFLTRIQGNEVVKIKLCEQCATARANQEGSGPKLSLEEVVTGLVHSIEAAVEAEAAATADAASEESATRDPDPICPACGLSYRKFAKQGRFGCAACYDAFEEFLPNLIKEVQQGNTEHRGRVPPASRERLLRRRRLSELRAQLEEAVHQERYELAAELRDEIRELEEGENTTHHVRV